MGQTKTPGDPGIDPAPLTTPDEVPDASPVAEPVAEPVDPLAPMGGDARDQHDAKARPKPWAGQNAQTGAGAGGLFGITQANRPDAKTCQRQPHKDDPLARGDLQDVGPDVGPKVGPDVGPKVGPDVGPKVGPDVGPEMRPVPGQQRGLDDFAGRWRIDRVIQNAIGPDAIFTGWADFTWRGGASDRDASADPWCDGRPEGPQATSDSSMSHDQRYLLLTETGEMRFADQSAAMRATRSYIWQVDPRDAARILVCFDDGRPFHVFAPGQQSPTADHDCAPDTYRVAYDFSQWDCPIAPESQDIRQATRKSTWNATWRVTGPRKSYCLRSRYFRIADDA